MADDLAFTFDTSFFDKGINKVMKGFSSMETKASTVAKGVSKGLTAVAGKLAVVFAGFKTIKSALLGMPEVGQAFGIAKDVFMKNLLFPLRKEIFPLLQKMLDWVRDSRGRFVKWGQNLANIFRAVVAGVKNIIKFVRQMSVRVSAFAEKIFGDRIKNINDVFNIVSFKLSTVIQFISLLVEQVNGLFTGFFSGLGNIGPSLKGIIDNLLEFISIFTQANDQGDSFGSILNMIGERFGQIVGFITEMTDKFLDGFVPAVSQIMTPLSRIVEAWMSIQESIFGATDGLIQWGPLFETLGEIVGKGIIFYFNTIALVVEKIAELIDKMTASELFKDIKGGIGNLFSDVGGFVTGLLGKDEIDDGIVKSDGTVIKTNPQDTLIAMKDVNSSLAGLFGGMAPSQTNVERNVTVPIDFSGMVIQVQNGGIEEGQEFAMGLIEQMRNEFNRDFERFGLG